MANCIKCNAPIKGFSFYRPFCSSVCKKAYNNEQEAQATQNELLRKSNQTAEELRVQMEDLEWTVSQQSIAVDFNEQAESHKEIDTSITDHSIFINVATFIVEEQNASRAQVQRKFKINHRVIGPIYDKLEELGIIGSWNSDSPQQVTYKSVDELHRFLKENGIKTD